VDGLTVRTYPVRMSTAIFCVSILIGFCAWGFLLAGALSFNDTEKPSIRGFGVVLLLIDMLVSLGVFSMLFVIAKNWRRKPEARRLLYTGASCLVLALGLGFIYLRIS
jgi:hypothetical protein